MKPQISQSRENVDDNFFEINGIYYTKNDSGETLSVTYSPTKYTGAINIPASVTYKGTSYPVTSIGDHAFCNCSGLISVTIPASVTTIAVSAFKGCSELTSINYNATNCNRRYGHGLRRRILPSLFFSDGYISWFKDCPLTTLNIGDGVKKIPN